MLKTKFDYTKGKDISYFSKLISDYLKENNIEINTFNLGMCLNKNINETEKIKIKEDFQKPLILEIEKDLNAKLQNDFSDCEIVIDFTRDKIDFNLRPVYIYGKYLKYSRELPQTIHYCFKCKGKGCLLCNNSGKLSPTSIQEIIAPYFQEEFIAQDNKFHGCGREDTNVRMLGSGRPFIIELIESKIRTKTKEQLKNLENKINNDSKNKNVIEIQELRLSNKKEVVEIKNNEHKKRYSAIIICEKEYNLENLEKIINTEIEVKQQTPSRVIKRRSNITRIRKCTITEINKINNLEFNIILISEGGLYIKEFISSDENRTIPSIANIINNNCVCKELDVLEII
jgi:tRNA pseudouridine synthase 10